jgi:hypothetical protein
MRIFRNPRAWVVIIGFALAQQVLAAPPSVFPPSQTSPRAETGAVKLTSTVLHNSDGASGITEAAGDFTNLDKQKVSCPKTATSCTVVISMNVQATGGANAGNEWAICTLVDGTYVDSCPYAGELLADGNYGYGYELESVSVAPGTHVVEVQVYSYYGLTVGYWQTQYLVYEPDGA